MNNQSQVGNTCPHSYNCKLFPILKASNSLAYWSNAYCDGEYRQCARFTRLSEGLAVAPNLLPNGKKI
jgi:hypothetical protein